MDCAPETAAEVVVLATDTGATVPDVQFGLREGTRRRLEDEAFGDAMDRAREKAERIAAAEGLAVGGVREVTTQGGGMGMSSIVNDALAGNGDPELHPDPIVVSKGVEVVYELVEE
ncbi:SIMPL domain-containing protein [Halorussus caseinilyticus]|uniref:SIMPL domain-containing protein n=1 Tax=Halorussus caseinilyticus TaxID=3034025 RepID=A0ABD5WR65_9EURY